MQLRTAEKQQIYTSQLSDNNVLFRKKRIKQLVFFGKS